MNVFRCTTVIGHRMTTRSFPKGRPTHIVRQEQLKKLRDEPKPQLRFPLQQLPASEAPSGFLEPLGNTEGLPFQFRRTASKQLPVYSAMKNGLTRRVTIVRGYEGSSEELAEELRRLIADPGAKIETKQAKIVITGNYVAKVKRWLRMLGF